MKATRVNRATLRRHCAIPLACWKAGAASYKAHLVLSLCIVKIQGRKGKAVGSIATYPGVTSIGRQSMREGELHLMHRLPLLTQNCLHCRDAASGNQRSLSQIAYSAIHKGWHDRMQSWLERLSSPYGCKRHK